MKFLRDIIAERSDAKPASAPQPALQPDPMPAPRAPSHPQDRTMTRLSDNVLLDGDDVFKRLLGEDAAAAAPADLADDLDLPTADHNAPAEFDDEEENLFDDLMDDDFDTYPDADAGTSPDPLDDLPMQLDDRPHSAPPRAQTPAPLPEPEAPAPLADTPFPPVAGRSAPATDPQPIPDMVAVPAPASGRSGRGAGRVKTRLLGFGAPEAPVHDPFAQAAPTETPDTANTPFPVGWLVVISGPGRGASFTLQSGVSQIGRGDDQAIRLDFGDTSISRSNHAAIAYDTEQGGFYLGHGGKANMVRLNDRPVLSTEELTTGALIRIGETTLKFVAFCDDTFSWTQEAL